MGAISQYVILLAFFLSLVGCTAATPDVSALGSISAPFLIEQSEIRVVNSAEISNLTITAKCNLNQTQFEVEFPNTSPSISWTLVPDSVMTAPFTSVTNNCATNQTLTLQLDLQTFSDFNTIFGGPPGIYRTIRFRDSNMTGLQFTDEVKVIYSPLTLSRQRFILGQGTNNTLCRSGKCLQGRVVMQDQNNDMIRSSYKMRGRVVWQ
ncbi:MAG: hypothetical protein ACK5V3_01820 [Bdellovibrionales bacterium]